MNSKDITIVVAVDTEYVEKLKWTYRTWMQFKPLLNDMHLCIIYDTTQLAPTDKVFDLFRSHGAGLTLAPWTMHSAANQREKMLTSLVFMSAERVETPWYLKLDADTYANASVNWIRDDWFLPVNDHSPVVVASPWGYTKPGNLLDIMDDWGDSVDALKFYPRLNIPHAVDSKTVSCPRFASWVMFGNTQWTQEVIKACPTRQLPVPSQDTFLFYCATRRGDYFRTDRMGRYGWAHCSKMRHLQPECERLLGTA